MCICVKYFHCFFCFLLFSVFKSHCDYRESCHSTWLLWPHPAKTSSPTRLWLKVNTDSVSYSFTHGRSNRHVKGIIMRMHSYACFMLNSLFHDSTSVTENELILASVKDNLTVAHSSERLDRMTGFVLPLPLFPGKLINPIVVSCLDRAVFCDWIQHFKAADVPVLSPPPPVYDIIYTPTQREVSTALPFLTGQKQLHCSQLLMIHNYQVYNLLLVCESAGGASQSMRK